MISATDHDRAVTVSAVSAIAAADAAAADLTGRLAARTVDAITEAGFPRHFVPRRWGGDEGGFTELFDSIAELAESCTSTGWCAMLWAWHGRLAAALPEEGQRELWGKTPDARISSAIMPPTGTAEPVPGGRRVSGTWRFASGVEHADWLLVATPDPHGSAGPLVFAVPRGEVGITNSWNAVGLRGTGSHDVVLDAVRVPEHRCFALADLVRGDPAPGRARCHAVPPELGAGLLLCAPALGAARHALAVWTGAVAGRAVGGPAAVAAPVWEALARSATELDAAGLLLREAARRADHDPVTAAAVARARRDAAVAAESVTAAVERLFRTGGSHAGDASGGLQRAWRDVHTVTSHAALRLGPAAEAYGAAVTTR